MAPPFDIAHQAALWTLVSLTSLALAQAIGIVWMAFRWRMARRTVRRATVRIRDLSRDKKALQRALKHHQDAYAKERRLRDASRRKLVEMRHELGWDDSHQETRPAEGWDDGEQVTRQITQTRKRRDE